MPVGIYDMIFCRLNGDDIKNCRLVCKTFERLCSSYLDEKTCIIVDGNGGFTKIFSKPKVKKFLRYLEESEVKLSHWSTMRIRNISENHAKTMLLQNMPRFTIAMQNVVKIELVKCFLTWTTLIKFLSLFRNLETYLDNQNSHFTIPDASLLCCQAYFDPEERTLREVFNYRITASKVKFTLVEPNWDLILMLRIFEISCFNLEEFTLEINSEKEFFQFERTEFSNNLGLLLLKHLGTLKNLTIRWAASSYHFFFEDFFHVIPVLMMSSKELILTELVLDFDWIFIGHSGFEMDLIPFIRRMHHLKKLTVMKVILQAGLGHLIELMRPPLGCEFNLGVLLSDHPTIDEALLNREVLQTEVFTDSIIALRVAIDLISTSNVSQLLPLGQQLCMFMDDEVVFNQIQRSVKFARTTELMIKHLWNGPSSSFMSYNINGVVHTFPNLTELCIFDGPKFEYLGTFRIRHQWDFMSDAMIMDTDLQLILQDLKKLKVLRIRACMQNLTDCGLTGLSEHKRQIYKCLISTPGYTPARSDILLNSVSNLPDLEECILKGVGDNITDVSAYFAFNGLKKLHILAICGTTKISRAAKEYLKQSMAEVGDTRYEFT